MDNLYHAQTKLLEAEEYYLKVIEIQPNLVLVHNNLGCVQQQQGKFLKEIDSYQTALDIQPNCVKAELNLASVFHSQGKLTADKQAYSAAENSDLDVARKLAGDYQTVVAYYQQEIAWYESALQFKPEAAGIHYAIANILQWQDRYELASDRYQKAMEVKHSFLEAIEHSPYNNIYYCCVQNRKTIAISRYEDLVTSNSSFLRKLLNYL